jgi:hypothetical protein
MARHAQHTTHSGKAMAGTWLGNMTVYTQQRHLLAAPPTWLLEAWLKLALLSGSNGGAGPDCSWRRISCTKPLTATSLQ